MTVWLFDLDNTLHDASKGTFQAIHDNMQKAVMQCLQVDADTANQIRTRYWKRYGATLIGMQRHHDINPQHFLELSHAFHAPDYVHPQKGLKRLLQQLPGKKFIYTNAPLRYSQEVIQALGIRHEIEYIFAIDQMKIGHWHQPKPSRSMFQQVLAQLPCAAQDVIFVEDTLQNLKPAKACGCQTVYIYHPHSPFAQPVPIRPFYVDHLCRHLADLRSLHR